MTLVTKRNGQTEELNLDKIHKIVAWACEGLKGVSESELELRAKLQFTDGIQTK
ncbi:ATP cone domain-containing protein, partial [Enterococcus faecalis]|uniref:ATP cone domain-containing protein n=1 Tax=Enterococcus faecalis TaxID=1351 RepID=UPI0039852E22